MCHWTRTTLLVAAAALACPATRSAAAPAEHAEFVAAAFKMKDDAVRSGDQAYGAVVVKDGRIIGYGPSRVVVKRDWTAHAEREAIRDAQAKLGTNDLTGCVLYSTSRPCVSCEGVAATANVARMVHGAQATDAGGPRQSFGPTR